MSKRWHNLSNASGRLEMLHAKKYNHKVRWGSIVSSELVADMYMFLKADESSHETFFPEKKLKNILYPNLKFHLHSKIIHCAGSTRGAPPLDAGFWNHCFIFKPCEIAITNRHVISHFKVNKTP